MKPKRGEFYRFGDSAYEFLSSSDHIVTGEKLMIVKGFKQPGIWAVPEEKFHKAFSKIPVEV